MDFLGNQTGVAKENNKNLIRLVPARFENGRGKNRAFFRDSLVWRPTSEKGLGNQTRMDFLGNQTRMDFLGNQTRMNFPENRMGVDFLGNQTGVAKKIIITY